MKQISPAFAIMALTAWLVIADPLSNPKDSAVGILVATTPCGKMIRPLNNIPQQVECALVEWKLTLYENPITHKPTIYKLSSVNRFTVEVTNRYSEPGVKYETEGKWAIVRGSTNPNSIIYRLDPGKPKISIDFLKLSDNLFHVLDHDGNLMVGNPFWSYTFSRPEN